LEIKPYTESPQTVAELVDLIMFCQNTEAHLGIKMAEQADVFDIQRHYQQTGGNFWLAWDKGHVVGCIGLLRVDSQVGVLKKFFTYPPYRGQPHHLGQRLFTTFMAYAKAETVLKEIVLDTPAAETRSHYFYEKNGFQQISRQALPVAYAFPDRQSLIYAQGIVR